ncbi:MAG: tyrosine transporter [Chlamydiia bacterium]|nr:tyrosine transporter [Chlamydiia bacterium]
MVTTGRIFRGALLVGGTSIGGGMLALPILTGLGGFIPSLAIYFLCWAVMCCTGLLYLEVALWMKGETNIISMADRTLGGSGKAFAWMLYLFLFYSLTLAYVSGCGDLVQQFFVGYVPEGMGPLLFVLFFSPFVFAGARVVGRINMLLMVGLAIFYFLFVYMGVGHIDWELLQYKNWKLSFLAMPIAFVSFGYQGVVPTLVHYMEYDAQATRKAIIFGSLLPLAAYIIWEALILGIVPVNGPGGIAESLANGDNAVTPLKSFLNNPTVYLVGQFFAFFAMATSFLGVTIGLLDFLADGLTIKKTAAGRLFLCALIFVPPLLITMVNPHVFLIAMSYAGGYGGALLLGLLPILMVWSGRYRHRFEGPFTLSGGRALLVLLGIVIFVVIGIETLMVSTNY